MVSSRGDVEDKRNGEAIGGEQPGRSMDKEADAIEGMRKQFRQRTGGTRLGDNLDTYSERY